MSTALGLVALAAGVTLVVAAADVFVDGLLGVGRALGVAPFVLTVALSGSETENLAAGIAANAKGLPGAAAGTFLGGTTFLALGIAGLGGLIAPMRVELPPRFAILTAIAPIPLFGFAIDGALSRAEGSLLVAGPSWLSSGSPGPVEISLPANKQRASGIPPLVSSVGSPC